MAMPLKPGQYSALVFLKRFGYEPFAFTKDVKVTPRTFQVLINRGYVEPVGDGLYRLIDLSQTNPSK